jgi:hypothetical protein
MARKSYTDQPPRGRRNQEIFKDALGIVGAALCLFVLAAGWEVAEHIEDASIEARCIKAYPELGSQALQNCLNTDLVPPTDYTMLHIAEVILLGGATISTSIAIYYGRRVEDTAPPLGLIT